MGIQTANVRSGGRNLNVFATAGRDPTGRGRRAGLCRRHPRGIRRHRHRHRITRTHPGTLREARPEAVGHQMRTLRIGGPGTGARGITQPDRDDTVQDRRHPRHAATAIQNRGADHTRGAGILSPVLQEFQRHRCSDLRPTPQGGRALDGPVVDTGVSGGVRHHQRPPHLNAGTPGPTVRPRIRDLGRRIGTGGRRLTDAAGGRLQVPRHRVLQQALHQGRAQVLGRRAGGTGDRAGGEAVSVLPPLRPTLPSRHPQRPPRATVSVQARRRAFPPLPLGTAARGAPVRHLVRAGRERGPRGPRRAVQAGRRHSGRGCTVDSPHHAVRDATSHHHHPLGGLDRASVSHRLGGHRRL